MPPRPTVDQILDSLDLKRLERARREQDFPELPEPPDDSWPYADYDPDQD